MIELRQTGSKDKNGGRSKRAAGSKRRKSLNDYGSVPVTVDEEYKFLERFMSVRCFLLAYTYICVHN